MKLKKNRKLHGSVLLTVVSVMALLIIFLFGTLVLASSTNNRAHVNYSTAQTSITSRSIVQSTLKAMSADSDFGSVVNAIGEGESIRIPVSIDSSAAGTNSLGHAEDVVIEYAGTKKYYFEEDGEWKDRTLLKITSNVNLAGVDTSSSAYIVKNPPVKNNPAEGAGFITTGGAAFTTGSILFGGSYINLPPTSFVNSIDYTYVYPAGTEPYLYASSEPPFQITDNKFSIEADLVVYGDFQPDKMRSIIFPAPGKGVTIWGSVEFNTSGTGTNLSIVNNVPVYNDDGSYIDYDFKDLPYIYVDQEIRMAPHGGIIRLGTANPDPKKIDKPFNIFARSINLPSNTTDVYLGGDLYLMDPMANNVISPMNKGNNILYGWTASVINKTTGDAAISHTGGNIYSKGNLTLSKMTIEGGVYCEGNLTLGPEVEIQGDIVCKGNLTINGRVDQTGTHDIYVSGAPTISGELYINGIKYDPAEGMASLKPGYSMQNNIEVNELDTDNFYELRNYEYNYNVEEFDRGGWTETVVTDLNGDRVWDAGSDPRNAVYYVKTNADGSMKTNPYNGGKYETTKNEYTAFRKDNDQEANVWEAYKDFYYAVDVDGYPIDPPEKLAHTPENAMSYFDPAGNRLDNPADAFENKSLNDVATLAYVYPPYAERDVIIGLATTSYVDPVTGTVTDLSVNDTQVVKQLKQLYEKINPYKSTVLPDDMRNKLEKISLGQVDSETGAAFPTYTNVASIVSDCKTIANELKADGTVNYITKDTIGGGLPVITKSCILSGNGYSAASDYTDVGGKRGIVFRPESNMLVVLDNFTMDTPYQLIVDDTLGGSVYFYIPGTGVISGSETDVANGTFAGNTPDGNGIKDLYYGDANGSTAKWQIGIRTTSYLRLIESSEDFQITTDNNVYVASGKIPKDKQSNMVHYVDDEINPPLLEQMHNVLGLKVKLGKPKAYVYGGVSSKLDMSNAEIQSVNIISSELSVSSKASTSFWNNHQIWYNNTFLNDIKGSNPPGVFGCFNANMGGADNELVALYVKDASGDDPDLTLADGIAYKVLYYDEY